MRFSDYLLTLLLLSISAVYVHGHEMRPGYLEITESSKGVYEVYWKVPRTSGMKLNIHPVLPDHVRIATRSLPRIQNDAVIETWSATSNLPLEGDTIRIEGLEKTMTDVLVRLSFVNGNASAIRLTARTPHFDVPIQPSTFQIAATYFVLGVEHILFGIDHLLFVLALLLMVERFWNLFKTITAFTLAHSITLALATMGWVHMPGPPVEAVIALSIVLVASEIVKKQQGASGLTGRQPWIVAFSFGLLHGFGFAGALADIGLPSGDIPMALLTFNLGVEIGQLVFVIVAVLLWRLFRLVPVTWPSGTWRIMPYALGSIAAFWVIERVSGF